MVDLPSLPPEIGEFLVDLRGIAGLIKDVMPSLARIEVLVTGDAPRSAQRTFANLEFRRDGSRASVDRIAACVADQMDFEAIAKRMSSTYDDVTANLDRLESQREMIREHLGMTVAQKLDKLLHGPFARSTIRDRLWSLVSMEDRGARDPEVRAAAADVAEKIEEFSKLLVELHDCALEAARKR